ncbi:MAG: DUF5906 domain-containing protein [Azonexus sp.]
MTTAVQKNIKQLGEEAQQLATELEYVLYNGALYAPIDYVTGDRSALPAEEHRIWAQLTGDDLRHAALAQFNTQLINQSQEDSFTYMVRGAAKRVLHTSPRILVKTTAGLKALEVDGSLVDPDGTFVPNCINWTLNEDPDDKTEVAATILDWVGGDDELYASLMHHLATILAPHWSAGRYILLIGQGRNGKSVLMTMLKELLGKVNCSGVDRQMIAENNVAIHDLNGKLLNLVMDGSAEFLKDSGREKSLITGENTNIRPLYKGTLKEVQTNALFIEGLNREPKSRDKSTALQARLTRFIFPNEYPFNPLFAEHMRSERMLGALLSLMIDHYVTREEAFERLAPTAAALEAQHDHMVANSLALQYIVELEQTEPLGALETLVDMELRDLTSRFASWRLKQNDISPWTEEGVKEQFQPYVTFGRKSWRPKGGNPTKIAVITELRPGALSILMTLKEEADVPALVAE